MSFASIADGPQDLPGIDLDPRDPTPQGVGLHVEQLTHLFAGLNGRLPRHVTAARRA